jgi:Cu/Ag efflux protein CusF
MTDSANYLQLPDGVSPKNTDVLSYVDTTDSNQSPQGTTKRYTMESVADFINLTNAVRSVAGKTGVVTLDSDDITNFNSAAAAAAPVQTVAGMTGAVVLDHNDITDFNTAASAAAPVQTVSGRTGNVVLTASDISNFNTAAAAAAPVQSVNGLTGSPTLTTANINDTTNKRYVSDAQLTTIGNTSGVNTGDQNIFSSIVVSGQPTITTSSTTQPLTYEAGANITLTTDNTTKKMIIAASGSIAAAQYGVFAVGPNINNVTGDGSNYRVDNYSVVQNDLGALNASTGIFAAPTTSLYTFGGSVGISNTGTNATYMQIILNFSSLSGYISYLFVGDPYQMSDKGGNTLTIPLPGLSFPMTAGDTVSLQFMVDGNSTPFINVTNRTQFSVMWF